MPFLGTKNITGSLTPFFKALSNTFLGLEPEHITSLSVKDFGVGVLLELIRMGRIGIEKGNDILNEFIKFGYYSPITKLDGLF